MTIPVVLFSIGEDLYAVDANTVREVVTDPRPTRLPTAPSMIVGAFNLRGEVVPMFDTAALLGIGKLTDVSIAVVVSTAAGPAGLVVSGLPRVAVLDDEIAPSELRGTLGVYKVDEGIAVRLDVAALVVPQTSLAPALTETVGGR